MTPDGLKPLLSWNDKTVPYSRRAQFVDEALTPANLRRIFWTILCFLPLSLLFLGENLIKGETAILIFWGLIDVGLSLAFLVTTWILRKSERATKGRRYLVLVYYVYCLASIIAYDFLAYPSVGEAPLYVVGVILPAVLFHVPFRQALTLLAAAHLAYTILLASGGRPPAEFFGVWLTGTFGIILASLSAWFLFSKEWKNYQQVKIIEQNNQQLLELNEQLREQKEEMNHVMALAAHDLRGPLYELKGLYELLVTKQAWKEPPYLDVLNLSKDSCDRQLALLNGLLESYRAEQWHPDQKLDSIDLVETLNAVVETFSTKQRTLNLSMPEAAAIVVSDRALVAQILENLISNAVKFSPPEAPIDISMEQSAKMWSVQISDQGAGIPESERERLFHKFFRASSANPQTQGAGLGLFIVAELARGLGGSVDYEPREPCGSVFSLRLPC